MVLNNKGQTIFFSLMLFVAVIVLAMALVVVVKSFVDDARAPTSDTQVGLDCSNSSISDYQKGQCMLTDLATPYFFYGLIGIAALIIGAKVILQ
jgi:hypothetical protein